MITTIDHRLYLEYNGVAKTITIPKKRGVIDPLASYATSQVVYAKQIPNVNEIKAAIQAQFGDEHGIQVNARTYPIERGLVPNATGLGTEPGCGSIRIQGLAKMPVGEIEYPVRYTLSIQVGDGEPLVFADLTLPELAIQLNARYLVPYGPFHSNQGQIPLSIQFSVGDEALIQLNGNDLGDLSGGYDYGITLGATSPLNWEYSADHPVAPFVSPIYITLTGKVAAINDQLSIGWTDITPDYATRHDDVRHSNSWMSNPDGSVSFVPLVRSFRRHAYFPPNSGGSGVAYNSLLMLDFIGATGELRIPRMQPLIEKYATDILPEYGESLNSQHAYLNDHYPSTLVLNFDNATRTFDASYGAKV